MPAKPKFRIGQIVWHRADDSKGVVQGYEITEGDTQYIVAFGPHGRAECYSVELTDTRPIDGVDTDSDLQDDD